MRIACSACDHPLDAAGLVLEGSALVGVCSQCAAPFRLVIGGHAHGADPPGDPPRDGSHTSERTQETPPPEDATATGSVDRQPREPAGSEAEGAAVSREAEAPQPPVLAPRAPVAEARVLPPVKCPKCGHRQQRSDTCERCGLVFARVVKGQEPWEIPPAGKEAAWARAQSLWEAVLASPREIPVHDAFVAWVLQHGLIELGVRKYRHALADEVEADTMQPYLDRLVQQAQAQALALPIRMAEGGGLMGQVALLRRGLTWAVAFLVLVVIAVAYVVFQRVQRDASSLW